jgi:iron uptake system component EfeO
VDARIAVAIVAGLSVAALGGCTADSSGGNGSAGSAGRGIVTVTSRDDSCDVSADTAPAGKVIYKVTNAGSKPTEFSLYDRRNGRIVGSLDDLAPGLSRDLVVLLPPGTYVRTCAPASLANGNSGEFTVTKAPGRKAVSTATQRQVDIAAARYNAFVQEQATLLLTRTEQFVRAYVARHDDEARRLYVTAHVHLQRIEPVVESFEKLHLRLDAREVDLERGRPWTGWHRVEKQLWPPNGQSADALSTAQRATLGAQLLRDTRSLRGRVRGLALTAPQIAVGATSLLEDVATHMVTGEAEVWSHDDLYDLQAGIDGARAACASLRPVLRVNDPLLETRLARRFSEMESRLSAYRVGPHGFVGYDTLTVAQVRQLYDAVNALSEPLSMVPAAVAM